MKLLQSTLALGAVVYAVNARPTLPIDTTFVQPPIQRTSIIGQRMMEVLPGPVPSERKFIKPDTPDTPDTPLDNVLFSEHQRPPTGRPPNSRSISAKLPRSLSAQQDISSPRVGAPSAFASDGLSSAVPLTFDGTVVIFARGTGQYGNIGQNPGPQFMSALQKVLGVDHVIFQGLNYPGSVSEFFGGGSPSGSRDMAALIEQTATKFPRARIVISGYSQGAQVVHNAVWSLATKNSPALSHIKAAVVFGDPYNARPMPPALSARMRTYCNSNDEVCFGGWKQSIGHLTYDKFAMDAAAFVQQQISV